MPPRLRIRFSGPASPGMVAWFRLLIPALQAMPDDIEVVVEIQKRERDMGGDAP